MSFPEDPTTAFQTGGLTAARRVLAAQYPSMREAFRAIQDTPSPSKVVKTLLGAVCAGDQDLAIELAQRVVPTMAFRAPLRLSALLSLQDYCRANGCRYDVILPAQHVEIAPTTPYSRAYSYDTEPVVMAVIPGAQFIPDWDVLLGADGTVLHDTGYQPVKVGRNDFGAIYVSNFHALIHHAPSDEVFIDDDVLFLSAPVNNFGHWLIDFLPRLLALRYAGGLRLKVAVPTGLPARYHETLARFGVATADVIQCDRTKLYRFRTCYLYRPGQSMPPNPHHVHFVRDGLIGGKSLELRRGKRVYLSRSSVGTRVVANSEAFAAFLAQEGFISADPADLSIAQQEDLLNDAEVMIGTFGSNLLGLYFAPPGCTVIALMHDVAEDPTIAPSCAMLGMQQQYLVCEKTDTPGQRRLRKDEDVIVDFDELSRRLPR